MADEPSAFFTTVPQNQNMAAGFVVMGVTSFILKSQAQIMSQSKYCVALALVACLALTATASAKNVTSTKALRRSGLQYARQRRGDARD